MKTLIVYINGSVFKYPRLYEDFIYSIDEYNKILCIFKISRGEQYEEEEHAICKEWDYFLIEKDEYE